MNSWSPISRLIMSLLLIAFIPGCVTELMEQEPGLAGDLFREESNVYLPPDIQILVEERREKYEEMNYIDNVNFSTLRSDGFMPEKQFNRLLNLRWYLWRFHRENEIALEQAKEIIRKITKNPTRKLNQDLQAKYADIRKLHNEFMQKAQVLLDETRPYRPWFYHRLFIMKSDPIFNVGYYRGRYFFCPVCNWPEPSSENESFKEEISVGEDGSLSKDIQGHILSNTVSQTPY